VRPSLESTALAAYRRIQSQVVKGLASVLRVFLPYEVADYLQNQKRSELLKLESQYDMDILIYGSVDMAWDMLRVESVSRPAVPEAVEEVERSHAEQAAEEDSGSEAPGEAPPAPKKKRRQSGKQAKGGPSKERMKIAGAAEAVEEERAAPMPAAEDEQPETPVSAEAGAPAGPEGPKKKSRRRPRRRRRSGAKGEVQAEAPSAVDEPAGRVKEDTGAAVTSSTESVFDLDDEDDSFGGFFMLPRR